jgi:hypothetical protein
MVCRRGAFEGEHRSGMLSPGAHPQYAISTIWCPVSLDTVNVARPAFCVKVTASPDGTSFSEPTLPSVETKLAMSLSVAGLVPV